MSLVAARDPVYSAHDGGNGPKHDKSIEIPQVAGRWRVGRAAGGLLDGCGNDKAAACTGIHFDRNARVHV